MFFKRHLPWYTSLKRRLFHPHEFDFFEKSLLAVSLALAVCFTFLVPPFQKPDEPDHFLKAVSIASGTLICQKDEAEVFQNRVPKYLTEFPTALLTQHIASDKRVIIPIPQYKQLLLNNTRDRQLVNEPTSCSLPFLPYLPAALAMAIPIQLGWNPFVIFYLGRMVNAVLALAICYWAIKKTPKKLRLVPLMLVATPMMMHQLTSYSKDAFHLSFGLLAFAYLVYFHEDQPRINPKELLIFFGSTLLALFARPQYFPLALVAFMIPQQKVKKLPLSVRQLTLGFILGMIGLIAVALSLEIFSAKATSVGNASPNPYVYPDLQVKYLMESPIRIFTVLDQTFAEKLDFYSKGAVGILGWLEYSLPWWVFPLYGGLGWYVLFKTHGAWKKLTALQWLVLTLAIVGSLAGLFSAMYLYGSPVASPVVEGLQGRYFLLLVPFTYWWIGATFSRFPKGLVITAMAVVTVATTWTVIARYYHNSNHYYRDQAAADSITEADQKKFQTQTITATFQQPFTVEPHKKLAGIGLHLPTSQIVTKPYRVSVLDEQCGVEQASTIVSATKLLPFTINDVRLPTITTPDTSVLCVRIEPFYTEVTADEALTLLVINNQSVIVPLYLH